MNISIKISLLFSGIFFLTGLISGIWKYVCIKRSPEKTAPVYVSKTHISSFLYSFAALLIAKLLEHNPFIDEFNILITSLLLLFFTLSIISYIAYGIKGDINNQFCTPIKAGSLVLPEFFRDFFMINLILIEVVGFGLLFFGYIYSIF